MKSVLKYFGVYALIAALPWLVIFCVVPAWVHVTHTGHCSQASSMDDRFMAAHHYAFGRLYPVKVIEGALCAPSEKDCPEPHEKTLWLCRWHAAEWYGYDPVTGKRPWR